MPTFYDQLLILSKKARAKIGIGIIDPSPELLATLKDGEKYADIVVIGAKIEGYDYVLAKNPKDIAIKEAELLVSGVIDGLIRGQADAFGFRDALAAKRGYDFKKIAEVSLLQDADNRVFLLAPISNPLAWTIESKIFLAEQSATFVNSFGVKPHVGILTAVRPESVGRNAVVDETWTQAEKVVDVLSHQKIDAKNYNIEIEKALSDGCNIIVMPNGAAGNQVFRACAFVMRRGLLASLSLGIDEVICENSRNEKDFGRYISMAVALVNRKRLT